METFVDINQQAIDHRNKLMKALELWFERMEYFTDQQYGKGELKKVYNDIQFSFRLSHKI
jgi:hypothetical protein